MLSGATNGFSYESASRVGLNRASGTEAGHLGESLFTVMKRGRFWEVLDADGALVCLTAYKKGALEVVRRLAAK